MDIVELIMSTPFVDIAIAAVLAGFVVLGVLQGAIRGLISIVIIFFSFLVAANLRGPLGDFLAGNWTQFPKDYNRMLAFGIVFALMTTATIMLVPVFSRRVEISVEHPVVDDALGAFLGLTEGFVIIVFLVIVFGSYSMPAPFEGEIGQVRQAHDLIVSQSHIGATMKSSLAPGLVHLLAGLLPPDLVSMFP